MATERTDDENNTAPYDQEQDADLVHRLLEKERQLKASGRPPLLKVIGGVSLIIIAALIYAGYTGAQAEKRYTAWAPARKNGELVQKMVISGQLRTLQEAQQIWGSPPASCDHNVKDLPISANDSLPAETKLICWWKTGENSYSGVTIDDKQAITGWADKYPTLSKSGH